MCSSYMTFTIYDVNSFSLFNRIIIKSKICYTQWNGLWFLFYDWSEQWIDDGNSQCYAFKAIVTVIWSTCECVCVLSEHCCVISRCCISNNISNYFEQREQQQKKEEEKKWVSAPSNCVKFHVRLFWNLMSCLTPKRNKIVKPCVRLFIKYIYVHGVNLTLTYVCFQISYLSLFNVIVCVCLCGVCLSVFECVAKMLYGSVLHWYIMFMFKNSRIYSMRSWLPCNKIPSKQTWCKYVDGGPKQSRRLNRPK